MCFLFAAAASAGSAAVGRIKKAKNIEKKSLKVDTMLLCTEGKKHQFFVVGSLTGFELSRMAVQ